MGRPPSAFWVVSGNRRRSNKVVAQSVAFRDAVRQLFGALLAEQNDDWLMRRHYFRECRTLTLHRRDVTRAIGSLAS